MKTMRILYISILLIFFNLFNINLYYDLRANQLEFTNHKIVAGTPGNRTQLTKIFMTSALKAVDSTSLSIIPKYFVCENK